MEHIIKLMAVTACFDDGQKISQAVLEFGKPIDPNSVFVDSFSVKDRRITKAKVEGNAVILELDPHDIAASIIPPMIPHKRPRKPMGMVGGPKPKGPPPKMPGKKRRPVEVCVKQLKTIRALDGDIFSASDKERISDCVREPIVEEFVQCELNGLAYNLFIPKNIVPGKKYPLVMFIADAGVCGADPKIVLSQGNGAVSFASDEWQRENPCYVLAPQIDSGKLLTKDDFTVSDDFEKVKAILDHVIENHAVDKRRIYATGQSMGCMASCEMNIRYPELFAASLLVAGQWDPVRMAEKCTSQNLWILVSENDIKAFPGMNAVTEALRCAGAKLACYKWDGRLGSTELDKLVGDALHDEANVRYTVFEGSSVVSDTTDDDPGANHINTWRVAYSIPALRKWLFSHSGTEES